MGLRLSISNYITRHKQTTYVLKLQSCKLVLTQDRVRELNVMFRTS